MGVDCRKCKNFIDALTYKDTTDDISYYGLCKASYMQDYILNTNRIRCDCFKQKEEHVKEPLSKPSCSFCIPSCANCAQGNQDYCMACTYGGGTIINISYKHFIPEDNFCRKCGRKLKED